MKIEELLKSYELHDSGLYSIQTTYDGQLILEIDLDDVWNTKVLTAVVFKSVYEISEFRIDRFNIIGSIEYISLEDYDKSFVTTDIKNENDTIMVSISFVAGGTLDIIAENSINIKTK